MASIILVYVNEQLTVGLYLVKVTQGHIKHVSSPVKMISMNMEVEFLKKN